MVLKKSCIDKYAEIYVPLNNLRRKRTKFIWTDMCQKAFVKLKHIIANPPIEKIANFKKPFTVMTDASHVAMGACILQETDTGDLLPVVYYSRKFTDIEHRYSTYEKEAYGATLAIEYRHHLLDFDRQRGFIVCSFSQK